MTPSTSGRYRLEHQGHIFEVESGSAGLSTLARLFVDDSQVDEKKSSGQSIELVGGGLIVVVALNWFGQVSQILAVPSGADPKRADEEGMAFAPPAGRRASKLERFKRTYPELYAARHVVVATLQVLVGVLGISALLRGLLPRIQLPNIPWPDLPTIPWPDLPEIPWPAIPWPAISVPAFVLAILDAIKEMWSSANWLVPIVIAMLISINEIRKRRKREKAEAARQQGQTAKAAQGG